VVTVLTVKANGSDVNLASHLLLDVFQNSCDLAAAPSNDSDRVGPYASLQKFWASP